jgi:hypothetical protein
MKMENAIQRAAIDPDSSRMPAHEEAPFEPRNLPQLRFLRTIEPPRPSTYSMYSLERALEQAGVEPLPDSISCPNSLAANVVYKFRWMWNFRRSSLGPVFVSYMSYLEKKTFPFSYWTEIIPYSFDCWPMYYDWWASFYKRERVRLAFISARQSAEYFSRTIPAMKTVWLPEATDPTEYNPYRSWGDRDIDVLEMGRRYEPYHDQIVNKLAQANRIHLYERGESKSIFPGRAELIDGLARTKILICFPRSLSHPESAGGIETVTYRYFQAMASKCLIVGNAPQELKDLFGYNPVLEVQAGQEYEQIEWVLENLASLTERVEQNYTRLLEVGTWKSRVETILDAVRSHPAFADRP